MDKLRLQWKIFLFLLGFCAMLLIMLWLFQTVFLDDTYKLIRRSEIQNAVKLVEQNINSPDLQLILYQLDQTKEIMVTPTNDFVPKNLPHNGGGGGKEKFETITTQKTFSLTDGSSISLTFHAMITPVQATVMTLRIQLYIVTIIIILLAVWLALIIARHVSKPIVELNKGAKQLANEYYDTQFSAHGFLEIKELSDTLNTAAIELSRVDKLRRELMANISHDLRTPLALIYSYAEMMQDFPEEISKEQTQTIMDEVRRLTSLVNDVMDISKLETGNLELNVTCYNLVSSVSNTVTRAAELVRNDGFVIMFQNQCNEELYISADEVKITQVLYNLLINAVTHSGSNKQITVSLQHVDNIAIVSVMDQGNGISKGNLPYIWDRYYRVDKHHKRPFTGSGLGLSIVKKIINMHNGLCGVDSEEGRGSTFWFKIPIK